MSIKIERYGYRTIGKESAENRYTFDFNLCTFPKGWAQLDTAEDASHYGTWAHPKRFKIVTYCEGDTTIQTADSAAEFKTLIDVVIRFHEKNGSWRGIDPGLDENSIRAWADLGLKSFLH